MLNSSSSWTKGWGDVLKHFEPLFDLPLTHFSFLELLSKLHLLRFSAWTQNRSNNSIFKVLEGGTDRCSLQGCGCQSAEEPKKASNSFLCSTQSPLLFIISDSRSLASVVLFHTPWDASPHLVARPQQPAWLAEECPLPHQVSLVSSNICPNCTSCCCLVLSQEPFCTHLLLRYSCSVA